MDSVDGWFGPALYTSAQYEAFWTGVAAIAAVLTFFGAVAAALIAWWQVVHARKAREEDAIRLREAQEAEALLAREMQKAEARRARELQEEQAQPNVIVVIEPNVGVGAPFLDFVIVNDGLTVAYDVKIKFLQKLETTLDSTGYPLSESKLLKEGVPTLPPGRRIVALFENSIDRKKQEDLPDSYDVEVTYHDSRDKQYGPLLYRLDFGVFYGLMHVTEYGTHHGAKALREIEKTLKKWTEDAHGGLAVFTRDGEAKDERSAEKLRETQARFESNRRANGSIISEYRERELEEERRRQEEEQDEES